MRLGKNKTWISLASLAIAAGLLLSGNGAQTMARDAAAPAPSADSATRRVIVQGDDTASIAELVRAVGGKVTHELGIIDAVAAELDAGQLRHLARADGVRRIYQDRAVETSGNGNGNGGGNGGDDGNGGGGNGGGSNNVYTDFPTLVGADALHAEGITGLGVTLAVLDTGHDSFNEIDKNSQGDWRFLAHYDAIRDELPTSWYSDGNG
ncbi:MAG: hypothetical protein V3T72_19395, partial [Thermoanaerobaculia bacterium]